MKDAVTDSDILVTVTPSTKPIVIDSWIKKGPHINAMGTNAPGKEELDPNILKRAKIRIDDFEQAIHSVQVNIPMSSGIMKKKDVYAEIGEVITGIKEGRTSNDEITIFDSTGLAIQDVATSWMVYKKAKISKKVNFL